MLISCPFGHQTFTKKENGLINPGPAQLATAAVNRERPPDAKRPVNISISMNVTCYDAVVDCECNRFAVNVIHS